MGLFDNMKRVMGGTKYFEYPLLPGERELIKTPACSLYGGVSHAGGILILTSERLIFSPWDMTDLSELLSAGLKAASVPTVASTLPVKVLALIGRAVAIERSAIASVQTGQTASLLKPPGIGVTMVSGRSVEFGVLARSMSLNIDPANTSRRDSFVSASRQ